MATAVEMPWHGGFSHRRAKHQVEGAVSVDIRRAAGGDWASSAVISRCRQRCSFGGRCVVKLSCRADRLAPVNSGAVANEIP